MKRGSSSNSFPKTFSIIFSPDRALPVILPGFTIFVKRPVWAKFSYKVFGKGARGDSPQCGEMSRSDRGARLRQRRTFPQKGLSPIITHKLLYKHHDYCGDFFDVLFSLFSFCMLLRIIILPQCLSQLFPQHRCRRFWESYYLQWWQLLSLQQLL